MAILQGHHQGFVCWFGTKCSTWSIVSRGSTLRSYLNPLGNTSLQCVADGNEMVGRLDQATMCENLRLQVCNADGRDGRFVRDIYLGAAAAEFDDPTSGDAALSQAPQSFSASVCMLVGLCRFIALHGGCSIGDTGTRSVPFAGQMFLASGCSTRASFG